jgi:hypothetical protein
MISPALKAQWQPTNTSTSDNTNIYHTGGNVGIGTSTPGMKLEIAGSLGPGPIGQILRNTSTSGYTTLRLYNNLNVSTRSLEIDYSGTAYSGSSLTGGVAGEAATVTTTGQYPLMFGTNNAQRMVILGTGQIGIGTNAPASPLSIFKNTSAGYNTDGLDNSILYLNNGSSADGSLVIKSHVNAGDVVGALKFHSSVDFVHYSTAAIKAIAGSDVRAGTLAFYTSSSNTQTVPDEVMRIQGANLGIGTPSPTSKIEIVSDNSLMKFHGTSFAGYTPLEIYNLGLQGGTGAMNIAFRLGYPYSMGVNSSVRLDMMKVQNGNVVLGTSESGSSLGKIGIGTTTPASKLDVYSDLTVQGSYDAQSWSTNHSGYGLRLQSVWDNSGIVQKFVQDFNGTAYSALAFYQGKIGLGTNLPNANLEVYAQLPGQGSYDVQNWSTSQPGYGLRLQSVWDNHGIIQKFVQDFNGSSYSALSFYQGKIGIGTDLPDAALAVKGIIHTNEVRVDLTGAVAPDYVFEPGYDLKTLSETETYIKENKHLPEVPSAKQMEEEGLNLKEMNLLLLKKVEELTLYLIDLKKETVEMKEEIEMQQGEIKKLKTK